jgi:transglutaminase-like putative cysteine protease
VRAPRRLVPVLPAVLSVVAAGAAFGRAFTLHHVIGAVIVSTVIGALAGTAVVLFRPAPAPPTPDGGDPGWTTPAPGPGPLRILTGVGALGVATLLAAVVTAEAFCSPRPSGPGPALTTGIGALVNGWSRILTTSVPVPPTADRLPLVGGVVALASGLAVVAAARLRPGLLALAPAGGVLVVGLGLGVHGPGSLAAVVTPPAVTAALYLLVVSRPADDGVTWVPPARAAAATVTGVVTVAVALVIGPHFPLATLRAPVDLRRDLSPPLQLGSTPNPIDVLPAQSADPKAVLFTARVDATWLSDPTDWRLVSLDVFDGTGWSTDATATRAGTVLSAPPGVAGDTLGPTARVSVHVTGLDGPWVPTTGVPTGVTPADLDFNPAGSEIVAGPSARGRTFHLTSRLPQPSRLQLDESGLSSSAANAVLTAVPACFPRSLRTMATTAVAGLDRPDQEAVAIEQALKVHHGFTFQASATAGSSCGRLAAFAKARTGTTEQYATAFALMARSVGLPARVAVGFAPGTVDASRRETVVHGSDAMVWPEIDFGPLGWVAFSPTPTSTSDRHDKATTATTLDPGAQGLNQVRQTVADQPGHASSHGPQVPQPAASGPAAPSSGWSWWYVVPIVAVGAVGALTAVRLLARRRRRRARRTATAPADRLLGAWSEILVALGPFELGVDRLTPTEVQAATTAISAEAAEIIGPCAARVDRAVYAQEASEEDATATWAAADRVVPLLEKIPPLGLRMRRLLVGAG